MNDPELLHRLDVLERLIREMMARNAALPENEWITAEEFAKLAGISNGRAVNYLLSQGVFSAKCFRNVGTPVRPKYRFHKKLAHEAFLNRGTQMAKRIKV